MCTGAPFTVEKISPRAGIELGPLDQLASAYPTELPGLLTSQKESSEKANLELHDLNAVTCS